MIDKLKDILTYEIKNTKALKNLDYDFVRAKLDKFILTYGDIFKKLRLFAEKKGLEGIEKSKPFKDVVKRVRDELRIVYGSFLTDDYFKKELPQARDEIIEVLKSHKSTKERIEFYDEIYEKIFKWYSPKNIGDLACGMNPFSYFFICEKLGFEPGYFASDLSSVDMEFVQQFFDKFSIAGVARAYDVSNLSILNDEDFQSCDLVFLFKALDSFEEVKKNVSKDLLMGIDAKHIVVSFPTKSLCSKRGFRVERRNWLFNFINKMGWEFEKFEVDNELFILIEKN